jgi:cellobiose dehydrogenase (acceptor)
MLCTLPRKTYSNESRRKVISSDQTAGGYEWGYALPGEPTGSNDEYIGYIVSKIALVLSLSRPNTLQKGSLEAGRQGWSGVSHAGGMPNSLLLVTWPEGDDVKTKFVWAG